MSEPSEPSTPSYFVSGDCLRCGACSSLAPGLVTMGPSAALVVRQPADVDERRALEAALFNCPMLAIRRRSTP